MTKTRSACAFRQHQRHGTLLADVQRQLGMTQQALWQSDLPLAPLTGDDAAMARMTPALQADVLGLPDVLEDLAGVSGLGRYRLMLLHAMAHRHMSGTCIADNWSPAQRLAVLHGLGHVGYLGAVRAGQVGDAARQLDAAVQAAAAVLERAGAIVEPLAPFCTRAMADGMDRFWRMRSYLDMTALPPERQAP